MIEKRITEQLLDSGELSLTEREGDALSLPQHSTDLAIELEGERFHAQWSGRSRVLAGDVLAERLQDYGQVSGLLRLRIVDSVYRLQLLPPGAPSQLGHRSVAPPVVKKPATKKARRRASVDRQFHSDDEYDWGTGTKRTIGFLSEAKTLLAEQVKAAGFDPLELVELRLQGEELATLDDFEELLAVDVANVERMPHQEAVARHALSKMRGRAVLADEVGLGKTIEAGLAVKELTLRGLAKRVLILCPAPLRDQWREEMSTKFDLAFDVAFRGSDVAKQDKLIVSLTLGTQQIDKLLKQKWDIVIVDEAHRAAGANARKRRELITGLTSACRYVFFLTATPVQNDLLELYRLVELLRPGTFNSVSEFKSKYLNRIDPRTPNDPAALRRLISSAMIRTTRAQAGVDRVVRRPVDVPVTLGTRERELYAVSTDLLRNVMRESADTMRRRSLALRLTASPFSMGTSALRMAERHPDGRVRAALNEVGHLAMDVTNSARENKALEITHQWVREHGRVLIFTQHTDTVTGLLRRMGSEGLHARSFHGSMSPTERAATIAAFRSGEAPVMISTDAGAEGQNLQFCNCVLNYDLPWNPMRIEQRIGRVDRLTQPKDEVFVANLYARGTIDESVYRLLAEKLRMFELLFGQVTTILGEIDESKAASFESRVLDALFAENDSKMERLLSTLGSELVNARERASTLIAADSGLSSWMSEAFDHRKGITAGGATELRPEVVESARRRQRRVQEWVRRVLRALGGDMLHDTGEGDGAFITVQFDDELASELGGRTTLHLAFDRRGMEQHPDAELCAVGSPAFDELLGLLRLRGDLHATVPVIPEDIGPSPFKHSSTTRLVGRRLIPSKSWSGSATFRATVGEAETTEHIITAEVNGHKPVRLPRRPLRDGETLPPAFGTPTAVISAFERMSAKQLETERWGREKQIKRDQEQEWKRIQSGYGAQITEANHEDGLRLRRALRSEEKRLSRKPDVRVRAKLLALILDEDDWLVEERWAGPGDAESTLTYEWGLPEAPEVISDASPKPISILALCSRSHWVDESEAIQCGSCENDLCKACGQDFSFADCIICGLLSCSRCRSKSGGLCLRCASPERARDLDGEFTIAWKLNRDVVVRVGDRIAELSQPWLPITTTLVPAEDLDDPGRDRLRAYARHHDLPLNLGLTLRDLTAHPLVERDDRVLLGTASSVVNELTVARTERAEFASAAVRDVPKHQPPHVESESAVGLTAVLLRLRQQDPPPPPPSLVVTRRAKFTDMYLERDQLTEDVCVVNDTGVLEMHEQRYAPLEWRDTSPTNPRIGRASLGGLEVVLERRNRSVLVTCRSQTSLTHDQHWIAIPPGSVVADELAWFGHLRTAGAPGGLMGQRTAEPDALRSSFPTPTECHLVSRDIRPIVEVVAAEEGTELTNPEPDLLEVLGRPKSTLEPSVLPAELNQALLDRAAIPYTTVARTGFEIEEVWQGHGVATHRYRSFDGLPMVPKLDDSHARQADFGICRDGHFYGAETAVQCASCHTWACRACDSEGRQASVQCATCSATVCVRCNSSTHCVPAARCLLCSDIACTDCGRDPQVFGCAVCARDMCATCRNDDLCPACAGFEPATDNVLSDLPVALAASGAAALIGVDAHATSLLMNRGGVLEHAVIRNGTIERWVAFGVRGIDDSYRLRLEASRRFGYQVNLSSEAAATEAYVDAPHVMVHSQRQYHPAWTVNALNESGRCATSFDSPDQDLVQLVHGEFAIGNVMPMAVPATPPRVAELTAAMPTPRAVTMSLRWDRVGRDVVITASGITVRNVDCDVIEESTAAWETAASGPGWVNNDWAPEPVLHVSAELGEAHAVIVGMASLLALGVRRTHSVTWYSIAASPSAAPATALARSMGMLDADAVSMFTDPRQITFSSVSNAHNVSRDVRPVGHVRIKTVRPPAGASDEALDAWLPGFQIASPELRGIDSRLSAALEQLVGHSSAMMILDIGANVTEDVHTDAGHEWRFETVLLPAHLDARRADSSSGLRRDSGVIDREGHFVGETLPCRYCAGRTCSICVNTLVECQCCRMPICGACLMRPQPDLSLCLACAGVRHPTRAEARQHGRLFSTKNMLVGMDAHHEVVFQLSKDHWVRENTDGEDWPIAHPGVTQFLHNRLTHASSTEG